MSYRRSGKHVLATAVLLGVPLIAQAQNVGEIKAAIAQEQWLQAMLQRPRLRKSMAWSMHC